MQRQHSALSNGGLIVTCLLDEPSATALPFVNPTTGCSTPAAVASFEDGRDYTAGMPVPQALVSDSCPATVFEFLTKPPLNPK